MAEHARIRLYVDEDVWGGLASALRARGYEAISVREAGRQEASDEEQLAFAASEGRAILIYNKRHFAPLAAEWWAARRAHAGIIMSIHLDPGELLRRILKLLERETAESIANQVVPLEIYK